jgi:hypothetical protein
VLAALDDGDDAWRPAFHGDELLGDLANNLATPRLSRDRQNGFPS